MKNFLKTFLCVMLLIVTSFTTACSIGVDGNGITFTPDSSATTKLSTPTNIRVDEDMVLRWNTIDNAESYLVIVNESEYSRTTPACDLKKIITKNGKYDIYIKAVSGNALIKNSELSPVYTYEYTGEIVTEGNTQTGFFGQFDNIYTEAAYIGYGYDVINSPYVLSKEVKMNHPIFDKDKLKNQKLVMINERDSEDSYVSGNSIESYQQNFEASISTKIKVKKAFSASLAAKYKTTSETTASALFYEYRHTTRVYDLILQCDFETYKELLTDSFKRDLMTLDYGTLFQRYGTHVITSAVMGGRFDLNYTMLSDKVIDTTSLSASVGMNLKAWVVDVNVDVEANMKETAEQSNCTIESTFVAVGGDNIDMSSEDAMFKNKQKWLSSIDEKPALVGIRDVNSLVGIWELLGDTPAEQARKAEMQEVFERNGQEAYEALLENYEINPPLTPESLTVNVMDENGKEVDMNNVIAGTTVRLNLNVQPELAVISKNITSEQSDYFTLDSATNTIKIKKDVPHNTKITLTVDVGYGVKQDVELLVKRQYTVSFDCGQGSAVESYTNIDHGSSILAPKAPTWEGHVFTGWAILDEDTKEYIPYEFGSPITEDFTLYAQWEDYYPTLTFVHNVEGCELQTAKVKYNDKYTLPTDLKNTGYTLEGCYSDKELLTPFDFTAEIKKDTTIYVKWKETELTVSFDTDGGSAIEDQIVLYNKRPVEPEAPKKEGYVFAGWYTDPACAEENLYEFGKKVLTKNLTLYAKWEVYYPTITFVHNVAGCDLLKAKVAYNTVYTEPTGLTITGYDFAGFYSDSEMLVPFDFSTTIKAETTIYVKWRIHSYTVSFVTNCSMTLPAQSVEYNQKATRPSAIENVGYEFVGWYKEAELINLFDFSTESITKDTVLYAGWSQDLIDVYFDTNGGEAVDARKVQRGVSLGTNLPEPTRENYIFKGWYTSEEYLDTEKVYSNTVFTESCTLFAKWEKNMIEISFDSNGGEYVESIEIQSGKVLGASLPEIQREFFEFAGWYTTEECLEEERVYAYTEFTESCTLFAKWEAVVYVENELSFIPAEGLLTVDLWGYQTSVSADCGLIVSDWYNADSGVFTVTAWYKDIAEIRKVIFRGAYMQEDEYEEEIETKFTFFAIRFTEDWMNDFVVEFDSFAFEAPNGTVALDLSAVQSQNITINVVGSAYIKGGDGISAGADGCVGINAAGKNFTIIGADFEIVGGNGADGESTSEETRNGGNGGIAIIVDNIAINMTGNLTIIGGNGGAAYNRPSGDNNGDGANGRDGYAGGTGGAAIKAVNITVNSGKLTVIGGNGGEGGDGSECNYAWSKSVRGGTGGNGGNGAVAINASSFAVCETGEMISIEITGGSGGQTGKRGGCHSNDHGDDWADAGGASDGYNGTAGIAGLAISSDCIVTDTLNIIVVQNGSDGVVDTSLNQC